MKNILRLNAWVEMVAGFSLIFNPHLLLNNTEPNIQGIAVSKMYGIMALIFGIISFVLSRNFEFTVMFKHIILCIICFHLAVGLHMYGVFKQNITPHIGASVFHVSLAIIFILIYLKNMQKFYS